MAKKQKKKIALSNPFSKLSEGLEEKTKHAVVAVVFFVGGIFFILSQFEYAGVAGEYTYSFLKKILGAGFFVLPLVFFLVSFSFFKSKQPHVVTLNVFGGILFLLSALGLIEVGFTGQGGYLGGGISYIFIKFFGAAGSIFLSALLLIALLIIINGRFPKFSFFKKKEASQMALNLPNNLEEALDEETGNENTTENEEKPSEKTTKSFLFRKSQPQEEELSTHSIPKHIGNYVFPPLSLLERDTGKASAGDIKASANIIKRTLLNFGIDVEIDEVSIGPSITRYAIKPAEGVRLSRIVALQNDLALALAAHPVRIEAPIPGKSLVGIEIPNSKKSIVGLATLLSAKEYSEKKDPLLIALGKSVTGTPIFANIAKAPHMLIAGATGAGKSVTIHSVITSVLFRNAPHMTRFIMIDPKRVELTLYNGIPHLAMPVITDPKKAVLALKWAIKEMERRYNVLETERVRDIATYHRTVIEPAYKDKDADPEELPELMPYIIIIIDELADIMATYPKEFESSIVRLAQMSRAVGIHLILSTQRPSVNVITGIIKANIPTRVALQVSSQIDSRTIIDMAGAEKLLGSGDMLYISGEMSKPIRLQSAYVTEGEVKKVVSFLKKENPDSDFEMVDLSSTEQKDATLRIDLENISLNDPVDDELYPDAKDLVISTQQASTSYLQRKLGIGYSRAAKILDRLQEEGVIGGPLSGGRGREVLIKGESPSFSSGEDDMEAEEEDSQNETRDL
jgi:S-DNA-T family DNA segregation ATPase FtsK/SpoIIIE